MTDTPSGATQVAVPSGQFGARIARGAAYLDERAPGWRQRINLGRLNLSECTRCVLGQLAGGHEAIWEYILRSFGIDEFDNADYDMGFNCHDEELFADLTDEWVQYIEATR